MISSVVVYCGSRSGNDPRFAYGANRLGELLAGSGITLVYGGGRVGLMGILSDAVMGGGGKVIGIIPHSLNTKEVMNPNVTELITVETMHERKMAMSSRAGAAIVLPGGFGTLEEMFEFVTWTQLGIHSKPCGLLNINGYFDSILQFLDESVSKGFIGLLDRQLLISETDPGELIVALDRWSPSHISVAPPVQA